MYQCLRYFLSILALLVLLISCSQSDKSQSFQVKPSALGVMNEIVVITDDDIWTSAVGDTLRHFFAGIYPLTPRPEPIFDLRQYDVGDIYAQPLKKELRTYLVAANLNDTESEATKFIVKDLGQERIARARTEADFNTSIGRDKWANGQLIIYVFAHGMDKLSAAIERNFNGISAKINEHDAEQLRQLAYARGSNKGLSTKMQERYSGAIIDIPLDFKIALDQEEDNGLIWLRKDTKQGAVNMSFRMYDYADQSMVSKAEALTRFNKYGQYVTSEAPNTYIVINDRDLPMLEFDRTISSRFAREWRGIWEMENDFMGGPFISYAIVNETEGKLLVVDTFVFAPGVKKRDLLQQADLIVKNIKW